jgi:hypothetical protein
MKRSAPRFSTRRPRRLRLFKPAVDVVIEAGRPIASGDNFGLRVMKL